MAPKMHIPQKYRAQVVPDTVPLPPEDPALTFRHPSPPSNPIPSTSQPSPQMAKTRGGSASKSQSKSPSTVRVRELISGDTEVPIDSSYAQGPIEDASEDIKKRSLQQRCGYVDIDYLEKNGYPVSEWLAPYKHWIGVKNHYNEKIIKAFYSNLKLQVTQSEGKTTGITISSKVRDKSFSFDWKTLNHWLHMDGPGMEKYNPGKIRRNSLKMI